MFENTQIIDISWPITEDIAVYPGNPKVEIHTHIAQTSIGSHISFGSHTATHIDAPKHINIEQKPIDQLDLNMFVGPSRVLDFKSVEEKITVEDLKEKQVKQGERILCKTKNSFRTKKQFYADYIYLDGDAADYLAEIGITLIGIDYLSIKQRGNPDLRAHTSLLNKHIPIIEAINLAEVEEGEYTLVALPLNFTNLDGSPTRAVLIR